jgi:hypothetical protein
MYTDQPFTVTAVRKGKVKLETLDGSILDNEWVSKTKPEVGDRILIYGTWIDDSRDHSKCTTFLVTSWKKEVQ